MIFLRVTGTPEQEKALLLLQSLPAWEGVVDARGAEEFFPEGAERVFLEEMAPLLGGRAVLCWGKEKNEVVLLGNEGEQETLEILGMCRVQQKAEGVLSGFMTYSKED